MGIIIREVLELGMRTSSGNCGVYKVIVNASEREMNGFAESSSR